MKVNDKRLVKETYLKDFVEKQLDKTMEMFSYTGFPEAIPQYPFERMLQSCGSVAIFIHDGSLVALPYGIAGIPDEYGEPVKVIVTNAYLNISKELVVAKPQKPAPDGEICVIVKNDTMCQGLLPTLERYGLLLHSSELTLNTVTLLQRVPFIITAKSENQKRSAESFIKQIEEGRFSVLTGSEFLEGVRVDITNSSASRTISDTLELCQYVKSSLLNELGILSNYNGMKKERITPEETQFSLDQLIPFTENMLNERKQGWKRVNEVFGTSVEVDFNSIWQANLRMLEKQTTVASTGNKVNSDSTNIDVVKGEPKDDNQ